MIYFVVLDVLKPLQHKRLLEKELEGFGIRLNKEPPQIGFRKKEKGGINLQVLCQQSELDIDLVSTNQILILQITYHHNKTFFADLN